MEWSEEQEAFFKWVESPSFAERCASINAVAGSGKTTTLLEAIRRITVSHQTNPKSNGSVKCSQHPKYSSWIRVTSQAVSGSDLYEELQTLHDSLDLSMAVNRITKKHHLPVEEKGVWTYKLTSNKQSLEKDKKKIEDWVESKNDDDDSLPFESNNVIYLAFNNSNVKEVTKKLEEKNIKITVKSLHSFGKSLIPKKKFLLPGSRKNIAPSLQDTQRKKAKIIEDNFKSDSFVADHAELLIKATCLAQQFGLSAEAAEKEYQNDDSEFKSRLINLVGDEVSEDIIMAYVQMMLEYCATSFNADFDDMIWMPVINDDVNTGKFGWVFIDEAQDLNLCQIKLILKIQQCNPSVRIIIAGDASQSIYGFRGAGAQTYQLLSDSLQINHNKFSLSATMRCPISHTNLAAQCLPHRMTTNRKDEGVIEFIPEFEILERLLLVEPMALNGTKNNLVLCRVNKPLVKLAYELIRSDITAKIINEEETFSMMLELICKFKAEEQKEKKSFEEFCSTQRRMLIGRSVKKKEFGRIVFLKEYFDLVKWLYGKCGNSVDDLGSVVAAMFGDKDEPAQVHLSSTHRSKGDEALHVWIIEPDEYLPTSFRDEGLQFDELQQELNCLYVALSRCRGTTLTIACDVIKSEEQLANKIKRYRERLDNCKKPKVTTVTVSPSFNF